MQGWRRHTIYAILNQKPYNFSTDTLKTYLSVQASSLSAFMISKTYISAQKPRRRQLNAKVCGSESVIFLIFSFFVTTTLLKQRYLENVQVLTIILSHLMLITAQSFTTTQRLHSYTFTLVDKTVLRSACSLVSRPHPLTRRNGLVNPVEFIGLAGVLATV